MSGVIVQSLTAIITLALAVAVAIILALVVLFILGAYSYLLEGSPQPNDWRAQLLVWVVGIVMVLQTLFLLGVGIASKTVYGVVLTFLAAAVLLAAGIYVITYINDTENERYSEDFPTLTTATVILSQTLIAAIALASLDFYQTPKEIIFKEI